jgi:hypothetical protein
MKSFDTYLLLLPNGAGGHAAAALAVPDVDLSAVRVAIRAVAARGAGFAQNRSRVRGRRPLKRCGRR